MTSFILTINGLNDVINVGKTEQTEVIPHFEVAIPSNYMP